MKKRISEIVSRLLSRHAVCSMAVVLCLTTSLPLVAQPADNSRRVDTLSLADRITFRTNIVDWALMVPNIGAEFDIRGVNWNRWSVGVNVRWRPKSTSTYIKDKVFNLFEATLEGRMYWRERQARAKGYLSRHRNPWDKLWSCRNMMPSHPNWVFYRGGYVGLAQYSTLFGDTGYQGKSYMAGVTWGFVKPMVGFNNGNSLDIEFGFSGGVIATAYDTYTADTENNCYPKGEHYRKILPMLRDIHVALVYRMGNYPLRRKYRWRYDVDMDYRDRKDAAYDAILLRREQKFYNDSIYRVMSGEFRQLYDSISDQHHRAEQAAIDAKAPKRIVDKTSRHERALQRLELQRHRRAAEKAEKAAKKSGKEAKK